MADAKRAVPSADETLDAIADGDAVAVAAYLQSTPLPDHRVLLALAAALATDGDSPQRLTFAFRSRGRRADPYRDMAIYTQVAELIAGGLNRQKALYQVGTRYNVTADAIERVYGAVKARNDAAQREQEAARRWRLDTFCPLLENINTLFPWGIQMSDLLRANRA